MRRVLFVIALILSAQVVLAQLYHSYVYSFLQGNKFYHTSESLDSTSIVEPLKKIETLSTYQYSGIEKNKTYLRVSPLFSLNVGYDSQQKHITNASGIGVFVDYKLKEKFTAFAKVYQENGRYNSYTDSVIEKTGMMPYAGIAHKLNDGRYFAWNNSFGIAYNTKKFFKAELANDKIFIGHGYRSLLMSNNSNSFPFLKLEVKVLKFKYQSIFANIYDLRQSNGMFRNARNKYAAIHYLQYQIHRKLELSLFEAIMFQPRNDKGFAYDVNYLNPIIFYRPVEYSLGSTDNAIVGGSLKWNITKSINIYSQLVLDEFLLKEVKARKGWVDNKQALQVGVTSNFKRGKHHVSLLAEFNYLRPYIFSHKNTIQNYTNEGMSLAHPYNSNFYEALVQLKYRSNKNFQLCAFASYSLIGYDIKNVSYGQNINASYDYRVRYNTFYEGNFVGQGLSTKQIIVQLNAVYCLNKYNNTFVNAAIQGRAISNVNQKSFGFFPSIGISTLVFREAGVY
jgi:hypothetical protein